MAILTEGSGGVRDQQSQTTPKQAVQEESAITQMAPLVSQGMSYAESVFDDKKEKEANAGLASFSASQTTLLQLAKDQPERKQEAITRLNKNLNSYIEQNPHLMKNIQTTDNALRNKSGLGKEVFQDTPQEAADKADLQEGISLGMVDPNGDPATQQLQISRFRETQGALYNTKVINAEYAATKLEYEKEADKSTSKANRLAAVLAQKQVEFYNSFADTSLKALTSFEGGAERIVQSYNNGDYDQTTATIAMEKLFSTATAASQGFLSQGANRQDVDAIMKPITTMKDIYITSMARGMEENELSKKLSIVTKTAELNLVANSPEMLQITALSSLLGPSFEYVSGSFLGFFKDMNNDLAAGKFQVSAGKSKGGGSILLPEGGSKSGNTREQVKDNVKNMEALVKGANTIKTSAADIEAHAYLDKSFESVDVYGQGVADPVANRGLLELIASKDIGELVSRTGGFNAETASKVTQLMEQQFLQPISKAVQDHWQRGFTFRADPIFTGGMEMPISLPRDVGNEQKAYSTLAKPVFQGGQLTFVGKGSGHKQESMAVRELNNKVRPHVQLIIQGSAHAQANLDYKSAWEELAPTLFPELYQFDGITGADTKRNPRLPPEPAVATIEADYDTLDIGAQVRNEDGELFEFTGGDINAMSNYKPVGE